MELINNINLTAKQTSINQQQLTYSQALKQNTNMDHMSTDEQQTFEVTQSWSKHVIQKLDDNIKDQFNHYS